MPVKIRLQRHGKKGKPFYWVVAADARAKRDGRYLEKLGTYNPNTNPATVDINVDNAVKWLENGAQPTDTARTLLSYRGVLLKHHLNGGVKKGALTQEDADKKFDAWLEEKAAREPVPPAKRMPFIMCYCLIRRYKSENDLIESSKNKKTRSKAGILF